MATAALKVVAAMDFKLKITETIKALLTLADDPPLNHEIPGSSITLNSNSNPPAIDCWSGRVTLSAGVATLDLSALPNPGATEDKDFSGPGGLKLSAWSFRTPGTQDPDGNGAVIVITPGAVNGYNFGGDDDAQETLGPGELRMGLGNNASHGDIGAADLAIDFTGTGNSDYVDVLLIVG